MLHDKTRPARIPPVPKAVVEAVATRTLEAAPPGEVTHWTAPAMAQASGLSVSSVQRIWRAHGLRPHQVRSFKLLSTDPKFAEKVEDIVGLYVDPPAHAVVLSIDEQSQIQALDPTQPGLPMKKGPHRDDDPRRQAPRHHHAVHGAQRARRQRHQPLHATASPSGVERDRADRAGGKVFHVILDNYGAHNQAKVRQWLVRHPGWVFDFTPTSCSWPNAVETFFAKLTKRRLQRGVFHSLVALQTAINRFVDTHNRDPKPFVWRADPNTIIAAARRGYQAL